MEDTFKEYEGSRLWEAVSCVIADLESNDDIELHTPQEYVVGYICRELNALMHVYREGGKA